MQLKFFHDVKCIIFIIEVLLLSPFINNFFGIILTYPTNHDILYHKSHWTCRLIANLLQKWLVITVRPTTSVRKNPRKKLPPRNTPDSFCRRFTRQNHRCAAWAVFFFFGENCTLKISWADRTWYRLFVNAAAQTGAGTAFGSNGDPITWAESPLLIFCALTIRKHLPRNGFERSGRGQEPSRGHKFSILENSVFLRDYTSATLVRFRSASCWGVPAPNPAE